MNGAPDTLAPGKTVAVIGCGNIGSQLLSHIARMSRVGRIICVDPDVYTTANLLTQEIGASDIGIAKAKAAARRLRGIRKDLSVTALVDRVENIPWGRLRADVICGCVDSKGARAAINLIARRLGVPYVDAGIRAEGSMARVDVYAADAEAACLECAWGQKDYETMSRAYSCMGELRETPSTGATSALGGMAAAMQANECNQILNDFARLHASSPSPGTPGEGRGGGPMLAEKDGSHPSPPPEYPERGQAAGKQFVMELNCHHSLVNVLRRNAACRFDHSIRPLLAVRGLTLSEIIAEAAIPLGEKPTTLAVERKSWVTQLACASCGEQRSVLRLEGRIGRRLRCCSRCGAERQPVGFGMLPRLELSSVPPELMTEPFGRLGLKIGDVVRFGTQHGEQSVELIGEV